MAFAAREYGANYREFADEQAVEKLASIWHPEVEVANASEKIRTDFGLKIYADGTVNLVERLSGVFEAHFNLASFPYDTQEMVFKIRSRKYGNTRVELVHEQADEHLSGVASKVYLPGWNTKKVAFLGGDTLAWNGVKHSSLDAVLFAKRNPLPHMLVIYVPFFLMMVVPWILTFYGNLDLYSRVSGWGGAILSLIAFNFTFALRYPALEADGLVTQVVVIGFCFLLLMTILTVTIFDPVVSRRLFSDEVSRSLGGFLKWSLPVGLAALILVRSVLTALL